MIIKLTVSGAPQTEREVEAAQAINVLVQEWAKHTDKTYVGAEVWVNGIIYQYGKQIGYYDPQTGEATINNRPIP